MPAADPIRSGYRQLLKSICRNLEQEQRVYFVKYAKQLFLATDVRGSPGDRLRIAQEYASHLDAVSRHRDTLTRYNITTNRDGSQREHVKSIAQKVGLEVPD
jgi:hypothetical protein